MQKTDSKSSRKIFEHEFYTPFRVERVEIDGVRHYATPSGMKYKSVTTILGEKTDKTALMEWRKRVGEVEANKISTQAGSLQFNSIVATLSNQNKPVSDIINYIKSIWKIWTYNILILKRRSICILSKFKKR